MSRKIQIYNSGDLLNKESQSQREIENKEMRDMGFDVYPLKWNKEVKSIIDSDVIVINPHPSATKTLVELGQLKGMKDIGDMILYSINNVQKSQGDTSQKYYEMLNELLPLINKTKKVVFPHDKNIKVNMSQQEDRTDLEVNQYVHNICSELSHGNGFYSWNEILRNLKSLSLYNK